MISYDLRTPGQNYQELYDALTSIGAKRILDSAWGVRVNNMNASGICDWLRQFVDNNDRVVVSPIETDTAWTTTVLTDINTI
jgi:hypothetical protein